MSGMGSTNSGAAKIGSIAIKPSPAANIRRLAATGMDAADIRVVTGHSAAEIKRALAARRPLKE